MAKKNIEMYYYKIKLTEGRILAKLPGDDLKTVFIALLDTVQYGKPVEVPSHLQAEYGLIKGGALECYKKAHISKVRAEAGSKGGYANAAKRKKGSEVKDEKAKTTKEPVSTWKLPNKKDFLKKLFEECECNCIHISKQCAEDFYSELKENKGIINGTSVRDFDDCIALLYHVADQIDDEEVTPDNNYPSLTAVARFLFGAFDGCRDNQGISCVDTIAEKFCSNTKAEWTNKGDHFVLDSWQEKAKAFVEEKCVDENGFFYAD